MTETATSSAELVVRPLRLAAAAAVAVVVNIIAFSVGSAADASWDVGQPYPLGVASVVLTTVVVFAVGGVVTWLAARKWPHFPRIAGYGGLAVGVVSMAPLMNAADWATGLSLATMHVATASAWALALLTKPRA